MRSGDLTAEGLVEHYCDRIEAYDRANAEINPVVTVNPEATARARELDDQFEAGGFSGRSTGSPSS
jgi:Asp-tRNA(Asn)/Glu-tRNA(Gln) amidotransferase A subunit family amidase